MMRPEVKDGLISAFYWICDKIVSGLTAFIRNIPRTDRQLTDWATRLLRLMLRHRALSLATFIVIPSVLVILGEDGLLEPLSDALDMFTELASNLPYDLLALLVIPGSALAIGLIMFRRQIGFGAACRLVFYAIFARLFYFAVLTVIIMLILQLTPLKADRRSRRPAPAHPAAVLAAHSEISGESLRPEKILDISVLEYIMNNQSGLWIDEAPAKRRDGRVV